VSPFARDLYGALGAADPQPPNVVFSPASIALALAMVREGARSTTAEQIDALLPIEDRAALIRSVRMLTSLADDDLALAVVNSMFVQHGYELGQQFVDALRSQYDTTPERVDYAADPEQARQRINAWVDDATRHRIAALLPSGALDRDTRLTLVNAIYMKARWRFPFPASATADADFTCADGAVRRVPTMRLVAGLPYAHENGWRCVCLPYMSSALSMLVVVPDAGQPLATALSVATSAVATERTRVAISLPRFEVNTVVSVAEPLCGLGMVDAFGLDTADFSGITIAEPMCIGDVVHQANITVDEEGTEAAAATAFAMAGAAIVMDPPIEFKVDRPFAFAVRDADSGTLLFLGHVGNPASVGN
jgi:serpin B